MEQLQNIQSYKFSMKNSDFLTPLTAYRSLVSCYL